MAELPMKALVFIVILVVIAALLMLWYFRGFGTLDKAFNASKSLVPGL